MYSLVVDYLMFTPENDKMDIELQIKHFFVD